jgi:hypothetical protein
MSTGTRTSFNGPPNNCGYVNVGLVIVGYEDGFPQPIYWDGYFAESTDPADAAIVRSEDVAEQIVKSLNERYAAKFEYIPFRDDL